MKNTARFNLLSVIELVQILKILNKLHTLIHKKAHIRISDKPNSLPPPTKRIRYYSTLFSQLV